MPVTYAIDVKEKLIRTKCVGDVKFQEVIEHFRTLERDSNCADRLDVFLDLSRITSLPATGQISGVAREIARIKEKVRFNVCAVVAPTDAIFGMLRMFEVMAKPYFNEIRVFRLAADAEAWLTSQRSPVK
jgi:hypothetical protein